MRRKTAAMLALCLLAACAAGCSAQSSEAKEIEYNLNLPDRLIDLSYVASDEWRDLGADDDLPDSHLYTVGKSNSNYIGLAVIHLDEGQVQLDENMEGAEIEVVGPVDLGDEAYEYKVVSQSDGIRHETYQVRIGKDGELYLVSLTGYDLSSADELWDDFVSRLTFGPGSAQAADA